MLKFVTTPKVKPTPEQVEWLKVQKGEFPQSLYGQYVKSGGLSEKQIACIVKGMDPASKPVQSAQSIFKVAGQGLGAMEVAFGKVKAAGAKKPKLVIQGLVFKPAPEYGKNPNAIYVMEKTGNAYLGKIDGGNFMPVKGVELELAVKISDICADPFGYATKHGLMTGQCSCCGKTLTDPKSIAAGIGPVCAKNWGW